MVPESVLNAVYDQLKPCVIKLAEYIASPNEAVRMEFTVGSVLFEFKKKNEDNNR